MVDTVKVQRVHGEPVLAWYGIRFDCLGMGVVKFVAVKILAIEKELPGTQAADYQPYLRAEAESVWCLHKNGIVRESYFHAQEHTAVLILECEGREEAERILATLPLVQAGLIEFQVTALAPYTGLERLFSPGA